MTMPDRQEPQLPARVHSAGCPAERVERFTLPRPDASIAVVTRCVDCGGQSVVDADQGHDRV